MKHLLSAALLLSAGAACAAAPSFDCAKARSAVEKAICADPALAERDASIARHYQAARKAFDTSAAAALAQDQRYFIGSRDAAFERPFNYDTPKEELADRLKQRDAFLQRFSHAPRPGLEGEWANLIGGVTITRAADGTLHAHANGAQPHNARWLCDVEGPLTLKDGAGTLADSADNEGWTVRFRRQGDALVVEEVSPGGEGGNRPYCGFNGFLEGSYLPVK